MTSGALLVRIARGLVPILLAGCGMPPTASQAPSNPADSPAPVAPGLAISAVARLSADPADAALAAAAVNAFGLELFRTGTPAGDNAVISPASVALALAMARAGARGDTASQMDAVLREVASDEHATWLNALDAALAERTGTFKDRSNKDAEVVLRIANAPFAQAGFPWEAAYLDALASRYGGGVRLVDYRRDAEGARELVNAWVGERTEDRIPALLAPGTIDELTRLVLVNAIYLKAAWHQPFEEDRTASLPFRRLDGTSVDVPTMRQTASFGYATGEGWRAVELPYVGDSLAMTIIVPDALDAFEATLDAPAFEEIVAALEHERVELSMPRFGIETRASLADVLREMGMTEAFDRERADFSAMTAAERLFITAVVHQANIDVDEEGTEAAAATAVVMGITSLPPKPVELRIDRPFLFALRDVPTGAILFLGRVVEPQTRS